MPSHVRHAHVHCSVTVLPHRFEVSQARHRALGTRRSCQHTLWCSCSAIPAPPRMPTPARQTGMSGKDLSVGPCSVHHQKQLQLCQALVAASEEASQGSGCTAGTLQLAGLTWYTRAAVRPTGCWAMWVGSYQRPQPRASCGGPCGLLRAAARRPAACQRHLPLPAVCKEFIRATASK